MKEKISEEEANKILKKRDAKSFVEARVQELKVMKKWTPAHWYSECDKAIEDKKKKKDITKNQVEILKELGSRVLPKSERGRHEFQDVDIEFIES